MSATAAQLYFLIQRLRGGVRPGMIERARRLLDSPQDSMRDHVLDRLVALHGPEARQPEWLSHQPLVERSTLFPQFRALASAPPAVRVERRRTSGSTGTPFSFLKDLEMVSWMDAAMWAAYAWHGIAPGQRHARFWGMPLTPGARLKRQGRDRLLNRRRLDAFRLNRQSAERFFFGLRRFGAQYAYGYPTLMRTFVEHCTAVGLAGTDLGIRVVVSTGEMLTPDTRQMIGDFFGARVVNEYGCTESGIVAMECEAGTPHAIPVAVLAEVVDPTGMRVEHGHPGEVVVSDLYGRVLPFLRYRLHDRAVTQTAGCACGRHLPSIKTESGRIDCFIQTPARGAIYDAVLAYSVPAQVQRFRATQTALDRLEVKIVAGAGFDRATTPDECRRRWEGVLGPGMSVDVQVVDDISYEVSGKLRYFVPLSS